MTSQPNADLALTRAAELITSTAQRIGLNNDLRLRRHACGSGCYRTATGLWAPTALLVERWGLVLYPLPVGGRLAWGVDCAGRDGAAPEHLGRFPSLARALCTLFSRGLTMDAAQALAEQQCTAQDSGRGSSDARHTLH